MNALFFHLNPLREAIQHGGDTRFAGLMERLETIQGLNVPAFIKEVGSGISEKTALKLQSAGARNRSRWGWRNELGQGGGLPNAGSGTIPDRTRPGKLGDPTAGAYESFGGFTGHDLIASGGVRGGHDIAKAIALGADLAALAPVSRSSARRSASRSQRTRIAQSCRLFSLYPELPMCPN